MSLILKLRSILARPAILIARGASIALFCFAIPVLARAQDAISASPDVTIDLGSSAIVRDEDVVVDDPIGIVALENLGPLPDSSEVIALGLDVNGDRFIAFETTTMLAAGVIAQPGDVIRTDGSVYSIEFDASAVGLPSGVKTDATSLSANGLLLSFDTTVDLGGGLIVADEDLVEWNGSSFALLLDGSAAGVSSSLDIDAGQDLGGGTYLVSFDTSGQLGSVVFDDEDVLRFGGSNWTLELDASALNAAWNAADIDAVMLPEPGSWLLLAPGIAMLTACRFRRRGKTNRIERGIGTC